MLLAALATAKRALPLYSHRNSPKKFTQHQLFACLVLKSFLKTDYRGVVGSLGGLPVAGRDARLCTVPHYTTLQKAARRLLRPVSRQTLAGRDGPGTLGPQATRSSRGHRFHRPGVECRQRLLRASSTIRRRPLENRGLSSLPQTGRRVRCPDAFHSRRAGGPRTEARRGRLQAAAVTAALARVRIGRIAADAGYDSEPNHAFARQECHVRSIIPAKHGRPTTKPATGHYRRLMQTRFDLAAYRDRVQVETVISMVKRRLEAFVRGRTAWSQRRELRLKVLTHNVMILLRIEVFYRARMSPFLSQR